MDFEFATATRILFGPGKLRDVPALAKGLGNRALIVTGKSGDRARPLKDNMESVGIAATLFSTPGEPTVRDVQRGAQAAEARGCDLVVGFGGGSALDAAKAIAALLTNKGDVFDYLEVVGRGQPLIRPSAPCIAFPRTAGTGAK